MRAGLLAVIVVSIIGFSAQSEAQATARRATAIPAQQLAPALRTLMKERQFQIVYSSELLANQQSPGATGELTMDEALSQLLSGTGLTYRFLDDKTVTILPVHQTSEAMAPIYAQLERNEHPKSEGVNWRLARFEGMTKVAEPDDATASPQTQSQESAAPKSSSQEVVVTGSRIKGAKSASRTIAISQQQMIEAGQVNLGEVIRSLTVNFNGGQNPGVAQGASSSSISNQNINSGSSVNLRGLGPDATLTLLNGRRLSYDSFTQAVDVSAIPLAAVEGIEIVADGTSALYGSDAVAGVANIKLKPDFDGFAANARYGDTAGGGNRVQQYSAVGGARWGSGGFIAVYDYEANTGVRTDQRSFTQAMTPGNIYAAARRNNVVLSGHQEITSAVSFSLDGLYNKRHSEIAYPPAPTSLVRYASAPMTESYIISPTFNFQLPGSWSLAINGTTGKDETNYYSDTITRATNAISSFSAGCYCNKAESAEADAEGPLFSMPGGMARIAVGGGYRKNEFLQYSRTSTSQSYGERESYYGFGELFVPVVAPEQGKAMVNRLSLTGAIRYENYRDIGEVTTPKLGLIYSPSESVEIKGSWGKSFKAPTLLQEYQSFIAYLWDASTLGATGYPATATALMSYGGNLDLDPERAETWSATLTYSPAFLPALRTEISYFSTKYEDRVIQPIASLAVAFSNPAYRDFIFLNPSTADQQALIARAGAGGITNYSSGAYNPANVVAIVNDQYSNAARQKIHGVDVGSTYTMDLANSTLRLSGQGSWISSDQQNSSTAPAFDLAGTIYNPAHFRGRAGATWNKGPLTLSSFLDYVGKVTDNRTATLVDTGSMTTVDVTALYDVQAPSALLDNMQLSLSVHNLMNQKPPYLQPTSINIVPYDSTNYSALGRFVTVSVSKRW